jgi:LysM repeat protein
MPEPLTRREVLIGGAVLLVAGCTSGHRNVARDDDGQTPPPYDLGPTTRTSQASGGLWYDVAAGDTLSSISRRSGVEVDAIVASNQLSSAQLSPGQRLWLPGASGLGADPLARQLGPQEPVEADAPAGPVHGGYQLVRRAEWTSVGVRGNNVAMDGVSRITVHHTGEHPGLEGVPEVEVLRRVEHYHQVERGWCAIGYHYVVGKGGRVYEGRPVKYQGAHVSGANEHNLGISVVGDYMRRLPNPAQLAALDAFLTEQRMRFRVGKSRVYGHRELGQSQCPGDALFAWVKQYRA